jgi:hypothetical protein
MENRRVMKTPADKTVCQRRQITAVGQDAYSREALAEKRREKKGGEQRIAIVVSFLCSPLFPLLTSAYIFSSCYTERFSTELFSASLLPCDYSISVPTP